MNLLVGQAIGDSLGMPFETRPSTDKALLAWDGESFGESEHHGLKAGQYTDDTQMALMVSESLIENNGFNPDDLAARYVDWIESGRARGYGRTTLIAVDRLKDGVHWSESGVEGSLGNGTAMRAAPFGVYFRNDIRSLINVVKIDSAITHKSDEAEAGALAIALTTFYIVNDQTVNMLENVSNWLPDSQIRDLLRDMPRILKSKASPEAILAVLGTKARVQETVPAALFCFLKFDSFKEGVVAAIRAGGDTDTTAAIVGALYGAKYGLKGIDKQFHTVEDFDKLINLDSQLLSRNSESLFPATI